MYGHRVPSVGNSKWRSSAYGISFHVDPWNMQKMNTLRRARGTTDWSKAVSVTTTHEARGRQRPWQRMATAHDDGAERGVQRDGRTDGPEQTVAQQVPYVHATTPTKCSAVSSWSPGGLIWDRRGAEASLSEQGAGDDATARACASLPPARCSDSADLVRPTGRLEWHD